MNLDPRYFIFIYPNGVIAHGVGQTDADAFETMKTLSHNGQILVEVAADFKGQPMDIYTVETGQITPRHEGQG